MHPTSNTYQHHQQPKVGNQLTCMFSLPLTHSESFLPKLIHRTLTFTPPLLKNFRKFQRKRKFTRKPGESYIHLFKT